MSTIRVLVTGAQPPPNGSEAVGGDPYALGPFSRKGRGIDVVGSLAAEDDVFQHCARLKPDVLLLDVEGIQENAYQITKRVTLEQRQTAVIFVSSSEEPDDLRRAMLAGAEEYLIKPLDAEIVATAIFDVIDVRSERAGMEPAEQPAGPAQGKIIAVASGKGGLGKTTIASNMAAGISHATNSSVALLALEGGDSNVLLNLQPKHSIGELSSQVDELDAELLSGYGAQHETGLTLFAAFREGKGEDTSVVTIDLVLRILQLLKESYEYVIVDTPLFQSPQEMALLEPVDEILCVTSSWDLLAVRNTKLFLRLLPEGCADKTRLVVNRADQGDMIRDTHIQKTLEKEIAAVIRNDAKVVPKSINVGKPFVIGDEGAPVSQDMIQLTRLVTGAVVAGKTKKRKSFRLFG